MKTAFITGASSGIGRSTAHIFAKNGYRLIVNARREELLQTLKTELEKRYKAEVYVAAFDVRDRKDVERGVASLPNDVRSVDVLVANAGLALGLSPFFEGDTNQWDTMIDTNIKGILYISRIIAQGMIEQKKGQIILIGSVASHEVYPRGNVYSATKHAVLALAGSMRMDLLPFRIGVSLVSPGMVETEFSQVRFSGDHEKAKSVYQSFVPLVGEDVAEAIYFAASRPEHVNISEIIITPMAQASALITHKS